MAQSIEQETLKLVDQDIFDDIEETANEVDGVVISGLVAGSRVGVVTLDPGEWPVVIYTQHPIDADWLLGTIEDERARRDYLAQLYVLLAGYEGDHRFLGEDKLPTGRFEGCQYLELNSRLYEDGVTQQRLMDRIREAVTVERAIDSLGFIARGELVEDV